MYFAPPNLETWLSACLGVHERVLGVRVRKSKLNQKNPLVFIRLFGPLFTLIPPQL